MTDWIYRVDFVGLDAAGAATTFSYATVPYTTTSAHPTRPNALFDDRLVQPLLFRRDLYGQERTYGDVEIPHGTVILQNSDGGLDALKDYGFDAQSIRLYKVDPAALDTDLIEFDGVMEQATLDQDSFTILVRDLSYIFDRALQPTKFLGNNVAPNGLEGSSDLQGVPKPICVGGMVKNIEPVLVNASKLIYQIHDGPIYPAFTSSQFGSATWDPVFRTVYDKGTGFSWVSWGTSRTLAELTASPTSFTVSSINTTTDVVTFTTNHSFSTGDIVHVASTGTLPGGLTSGIYYFARVVAANQISLHDTPAHASAGTGRYDITSAGSGTITIATNRTGPGMWDGCSDASGSYIRLGSQPVNQLTMDMVNYGTPTAVGGYGHEVVAYLIGRVGSYTIDNRVSGADYQVGHYWTDETTLRQALMDALHSANASQQLYPNRAGTSPVYLTLQRLQAPLGTSRFNIDEGNLIAGSFKKIQPSDTERGIPPWRINARFAKNNSPRSPMQVGDFGGGTFVDFSIIEYRAKQVDVSAIKLKYPASPELTFDTTIANSTDAGLMGTYLSGLFSNASRGMYALDVGLADLDGLTFTSGGLTIPGLMLGDTVKVTYPRFGFNAGVYMVVLGMTLDYAKKTVSLVLWG